MGSVDDLIAFATQRQFDGDRAGHHRLSMLVKDIDVEDVKKETT